MRNKIKNIFNIKVILFFLIFVSVLTISIGYSVFSTKLYIAGDAAVRVYADIRINSIKTDYMVDGAYDTYNPSYSKNSTTVYTSFESDGSAHYTASIQNNSNKQYMVSKITITNNTSDLCFLNGLAEGDVIEPNTIKEFENVVLSSGMTSQDLETSSSVCTISYEFEEYVPAPEPSVAILLSDKVISDNGGRDVINSKASPDFSVVPTADNSGMYSASEDSGTTYYFRGIIDNNYVYFADSYWRIIRVTNDNSVRMIYQGKTADATGTDATTGSKSQYINVSGSKSSTAASPYKNVYGPSTAAANINTFYENNFLSYQDKISLTSQYCNDVTDTSGNAQVSASTIFSDVTSSVNYAAYKTRYGNNSPTFTCPTNAYRYAVTGGNQTLTYPVAMITMDEVMYAGGLNAANSDYYLNSNIDFWVMTPWQYNYVIGVKTSAVFIVKADGTLNGDLVQNSHYLRPVITLTSDTVWGGGNGTADNPYTIGKGSSDVTIDPTPYANTTLVNTVQSIYEAGDTSVYYHTSSLSNSAGDDSYRYSGKNPNNYVCFGSDDVICPDDNLYRIIGVIDGKVKLISADYATTNMLGTDGGYINTVSNNTSTYLGYASEAIPTYAYNNKNGTDSNNTWSESPFVLQNLNTNFLNNFSSNWQSKIVDTVWKVGNINYFTAIYETASEAYNLEMGNTETFSAKVGLLYAHEYGFATSPLFWTKEMDSYSNAYVRDANWMYLGLKEWLISHGNTLNYTNFAGAIDTDAGIGYNHVYDGLVVRPTFSIDSNVIYTGGTGTRSDPMRLS